RDVPARHAGRAAGPLGSRRRRLHQRPHAREARRRVRGRPPRSRLDHRTCRPRAMNRVLGTLGVVLALSGSLLGVASLGFALARKRRDLQWIMLPYALVVLGGAVLAVFAMERALITRDFTVQFVADNGSTRT